MAALPPNSVEYYQCEEAVRRLTEYLNHELKPDEEDRVQHHLSQCKGCFAKFHFEEALLRTIRERAGQIRAPESLRTRILSLLHETDKAKAEHSMNHPTP